MVFCRFGVDVDFDFNILTAFIRLGRARPAGAGCPPYYYLTFYYLANAEINKLTLKTSASGRNYIIYMKKPFYLLGLALCMIFSGAGAQPSADTAAFKPDLILLQPHASPPDSAADTLSLPRIRLIVADSARVDLPEIRRNISGRSVRYRIEPLLPVDSAMLFVRHSQTRVDTLGVFTPSGGNTISAEWDCADVPDQDAAHLQFGYVLYADTLIIVSPPKPHHWSLLRGRGRAPEKRYNIKQLTRPGEFEIDCDLSKWSGAKGERIGDIGQFKMLWTGAKLFFIAQIKDSSITPGDFVELHVDVHSDRAEFPGANHRSLRFGPLTRSRIFAGEFVNGRGYVYSDEISQSLSNGMVWKTAVDSINGEYIVEATVPFPLLSDIVFPPPQIGFDVSVMNVDKIADSDNDSDGVDNAETVESFYSWAGAERFTRYSPSKWGTGRTTQAALALKIVFVLVLILTCAIPLLFIAHVVAANRKEGKEDLIVDASDNSPVTEKILALIEEKLSDVNFCFNDVAKSVDATKEEIAAAIRQDFDCTFDQLLAFRRIKRSQSLMKDANLDIEKIAAMCGFASVSAYKDQYMARMKVDPEVSRTAMLEKIAEEEREAEEDEDD